MHTSSTLHENLHARLEPSIDRNMQRRASATIISINEPLVAHAIIQQNLQYRLATMNYREMQHRLVLAIDLVYSRPMHEQQCDDVFVAANRRVD
ncbi:hypothetical protein N7517_005395 [Penicillium concentricum]|uniref:Uncharacterized protein n=1 Tax=Penicillium concentricum TaxID=293559 RepID=A0A9W9VAB2_9EURO|nr:uncharacterized protein N7517_005395 [Penicillium concentricum]KAJ5373389.1 hypothetical protein N7517_005395 [Penicillium concentricum]